MKLDTSIYDSINKPVEELEKIYEIVEKSLKQAYIRKINFALKLVDEDLVNTLFMEAPVGIEGSVKEDMETKMKPTDKTLSYKKACFYGSAVCEKVKKDLIFKAVDVQQTISFLDIDSLRKITKSVRIKLWGEGCRREDDGEVIDLDSAPTYISDEEYV